jgi:hypothetical protein
MSVDVKAATDRLMRFLAVEGVTGQEAAIGREIAAATGQNEPHTTDEWISRDEYERACALAVRLATVG